MMKKSDDICKYWMEDDVELCKASGKRCYCGASMWYCDYPKKRREKDGK